MLKSIGRRGLLKAGTLTAASVLAPWASPPQARAAATAGLPERGAKGRLGSDRMLEALKEAVRWPRPSTETVVSLTTQFIATHRDREAYHYFHERSEAAPTDPLFQALEGLFQARMADEVFLLRRVGWVKDAIAKLDRAADTGHPIARYFRGVVLAEVPARFGRAESAVADLEWVLQNRDSFPPGLLRSVYRGLAQAHTTLGQGSEASAALARSGYPSLDPALPQFTTDFSVGARDGFRFRPPRLLEVAPGVQVAQGYDFADIGFVLTDTGIVAIDAGTTDGTARAAVAALRQRSSQPITHVVLTHAHWDHIGGLSAVASSGTRVIAQARFAEELRLVNETGVPFRYFFGSDARRRFDVVPDHLVDGRESLTVGHTELVLYPIRGGETADGLLVHLPAAGVVFVGDAFMPYLGAPFLPEGSPEGLFETIALIRSLEPRRLVHGHPPLSELFTVESLAGLEAALRDVHARTLEGIGAGQTLAELLQQNWLPSLLQDDPRAVLPFVVMRDNFIQRIVHQRTGYWKADGEGIEVLTPREWAGALNLLAGGEEAAFVRSTRTLLEQGDDVLALKLVELGLLEHPAGQALTALRRRALDQLRTRYQSLNPFKFIVYSEWAGADLDSVA
jgi:glyoxylase-like metal-dependent hydrolase (beta-lactamase superfamily II)